jgi:hypothetical protein
MTRAGAPAQGSGGRGSQAQMLHAAGAGQRDCMPGPHLGAVLPRSRMAGWHEVGLEEGRLRAGEQRALTIVLSSPLAFLAGDAGPAAGAGAGAAAPLVPVPSSLRLAPAAGAALPPEGAAAAAAAGRLVLSSTSHFSISLSSKK